MRKLLLGLVAAASLLGASATVGGAEAAPTARVSDAVYNVGDIPALERVQYFYGGENYCWYDGGWRGPGFYWCGYAWRRGYGWGGGYGWRGWHGGHGWHGGGWHGGGWHDGGHDWHGGGGWHGDHGGGGGWHGDHGGGHDGGGHHH